MNSFDENSDLFRYQYVPLPVLMNTRDGNAMTSCLFRLAHVISSGSDLLIFLPKIFNFLRICESVVSLLIPAMFIVENNGEYKSIFHEFFRMLVPLPSYTCCIIMMCLSSISIFTFIFSLFYLRKHFVNKAAAFFIYVFAGEFPIIISTILCSCVSHLFASIIGGISKSNFPNFIFLTILYIVDLVIVYNNEKTMLPSLLYDGGRGATCKEPKKTIIFNNLLIGMTIVLYRVNKMVNFLIITSVLFISFGFLSIIRGRRTMFIIGKPDIETISKGISLITASIFLIIMVYSPNLSIKIFANVVLFIYIISYISLNIYYRNKGKKMAKKLEMCDLDFEDLCITSFDELVEYMSYGFYYGVNTAINGEFLEWGMRRYSFTDLSCTMTIYASLLNTPPLYASYFNDNETVATTYYEDFVNFEYYVIRMSSTVSGLPDEVIIPIKEAINRCTKFPEQEEKIVSHFSTDANVNFLLLQLINDIKKDLEFFVKISMEFFPNSLSVLKLSYLYYKNVAKDLMKANEIKLYINELNHDNTKYVSLRFLEPLAILPEAQKAINEYNNIQFFSYCEQNEGRALKNDSWKKSDSSSSELENPEEVKPLKLIHYNNVNAFITFLVIVIYLSGMIFAFAHFYASLSADIKLQHDMVVYAYQIFNTIKYFSYGTSGAVLQMHGDGNNELLSEIKSQYKDFTNYSGILNIYQNINRFHRYDSMETLIKEITLSINYPSPANNDVNITTSFYSLLSEVYDYIYETIDKTENSTAIDEAWFRYLSSLQLYVAFYESHQFSMLIKKGLANWADISFFQKYNNLSSGLWVCLVSVVIIIFLCIDRYYLLHSMTKKLQEKTKETERIGLYLDKSYYSLRRSNCVFVIYIFIVVLILVSIMLILGSFVRTFNIYFRQFMMNDANDIAAISISHSVVTAYEIANIEPNMSKKLEETLESLREHALRFFLTNETDDSIQLERCHTNVFKLIHIFITSPLNKTTVEDFYSIREAFINDMIPGIESYNNITMNDQDLSFYHTHEYLVFIMYLSFLLFLISLILIVYSVMFLKNIYNQMVSIENRFDNIFMFKFINNKSTRNKGAVLDVIRVEQPCVLTTDADMIVEVNISWKNIFGKEGYDYIGKPVTLFLNRFDDSSIITRDVGNNMNLIIVDVNQKIIEEKKALEELTNIVKRYTTGFNVTVFNNSLSDRYSYEFLSIVSIIFNSGDSHNSSGEMKDINRIIAEMLKTYTDVEVVKNSYRQYMFIFGLNGSIGREVIASEAASFATEVLFYTSNASSESIYKTQCVIVSGKGVYKLPESGIGMFNITGEIIDKCKALFSLSVPNSLTICEKTHAAIQKANLRPFFPSLFRPLNGDSTTSLKIGAYQLCI